MTSIKDRDLNGAPLVTIHTDKKTNTSGAARARVSIITEPEDRIYRIFFKRRRRDDNTSVPCGYITGGCIARTSFCYEYGCEINIHLRAL